MQTAWFLQMVYVDDLRGVFVEERKFLNLWVWLLAFEMVGTPLGCHKFKGGFESEFVGFQLRYDSCEVSISLRRGDWLRNWIREAASKEYVVVTRNFAEFLGRLGFVSPLLVLLKPHLAPLCSWAAATSSGTVCKLPETVIYTLEFIAAGLESETYLVSAVKMKKFKGEQFRTDAKCTDNLVVLAGWEMSSGKGFKIDVTEAQAPYLFSPGKGSQWASRSAELLASMAALIAFGWAKHGKLRKQIEMALGAGTDNRSNEYLSQKRSTTRWPLMIINICNCRQSFQDQGFV